MIDKIERLSSILDEAKKLVTEIEVLLKVSGELQKISSPKECIKKSKFYTRKETADLFHITLPTLNKITKDGLIIPLRVGSRVLYEAAAIDEMVAKGINMKYRRG